MIIISTFLLSYSMNRQISVCSRIVAFQQRQRNWIQHEKRLIQIKPTINTRTPNHTPNPYRKINLQQTFSIELQNKALLKKLTEKVRQPTQGVVCSQSARSLQRSNRKRYYEQYKLRRENQGFYKRLKEAKPMTSNSQLLKQRMLNQKYLNTISRFGYSHFKPNKSILQFSMPNNELKYLKRSIIRKDKQQPPCQNINHQSQQSQLSPGKSRAQNSEILDYWRDFRPYKIGKQKVYLKIVQQNEGLAIQLKTGVDKQNEQSMLQMLIPWDVYQRKYDEEVSNLLESFRYNPNLCTFYIQ